MTSIVQRPLVIFYLAALYYRDLDPRDKIMECYGIINEKSITFSILNICEKQFKYSAKYDDKCRYPSCYSVLRSLRYYKDVKC